MALLNVLLNTKFTYHLASHLCYCMLIILHFDFRDINFHLMEFCVCVFLSDEKKTSNAI